MQPVNTFVVPRSSGVSSTSISEIYERKTRIVYSNMIHQNDSIRAFSFENEDVEDYDNENLYDYKTTSDSTSISFRLNSEPYLIFTTESSEGTAGSYEEFTIDFICLAGATFSSAGVGSVLLYYYEYDEDSGEYYDVLFSSYNVSEFRDNQPLCIFFNEVTTHKIKIKFTEGNGDFFVDLIYAGNSDNYIKFESLPDTGFQPGFWNNKNSALQTVPSSNAAIPIVMSNKGTEEKYNFSLMSRDFAYSDFRKFINKYKGYPVFSQWNSLDYPDQVIFGRVEFGTTRHSSDDIISTSFSIEGEV